MTQNIAHYRIVSLLGKGGAGEVYEAFDTKLERSVALKLLPVGDAERLLREARAASALDHPNIVAVHDVGEDDGRAYVVMPLVKGKTLRERMAEGRIPIEEAIDIASQIASGLAAAHAKHVVHRDLKPENVMLTKDGVAKVVDFGIAATTEAASETSEAATMERRVSGTPGYMSPEQAEGKRADARSDLFALGCVLFEMLAGRRAFTGETEIASITSVLRDDPAPLLELRGDCPAPLARAVERLLRKDPERRWHSAADFRETLLEIRETTSSRRAFRKGGALAVVLGIVAAALAFALLRFTTEPALRFSPPVPVSSLPGHEQDPSISPDGEFVAFVWVGPGDTTEQIYVQRIGAGSPLRVTKHDGDIHFPTWSPDGQEIAFAADVTPGEGPTHDVFIVSALGGAHRRVATILGNRIDWSPDGRTLAVQDAETAGEMTGYFALDLETGAKTRLTKPPEEFFGDMWPSWSPSGERLAFVRNDGGTAHICIVSEGDDSVSCPHVAAGVAGVDWLTEAILVISKNARLSGDAAKGLWMLPVEGGPLEPIESASGLVSVPSASAMGSRIAYRRELLDFNIWRTPGPSATKESPPEKLFASTLLDHQPQISPDGEWVAFRSDRTGFPQIWLGRLEDGRATQLTFGDEMVDRPRWSPDGTAVVYSEFRGDGADFYAVEAMGGIPRLLSEGMEIHASYSRDGTWIYFASMRGFDEARDKGRRNPFDIWKMPSGGGEWQRITWGGGVLPYEGPDGRFVYYHKNDGWLWRVPVVGGEEERVVDNLEWLHWDVYDEGACYLSAGAERFFE